MDSGTPTRLDAVAADKLGKKLRLTGQVLAYDAQTGMVVLRVRDVAVLVDASNCVSAWTGWLRERLGTVSAVGYLERAPANLRVPVLPEHFAFRDLKLDKGLVLQAILVVAASDLEMETFDLGTREENNGSRKPANRSYPRFVILPN